MRTYNTSPMYRSVVGFDRLAARLDAAAKTESQGGYPAYNIESVGENAYLVEIAVAGFKMEELTLESRENVLTVSGRKADNDTGRRFLHQGLAARNFDRRFQLADHVTVSSAQLADGVLTIALKRDVPDSLKPRRIPIAAPQVPPVEASRAEASRVEAGAA